MPAALLLIRNIVFLKMICYYYAQANISLAVCTVHVCRFCN